MISVIDVAQHCGVSPSTVCRALNNKNDINLTTRKKVLAACDLLGYTKNRAASQLRTQKSSTIVLVLPDQSHELFIEKSIALKEVIQAAGYAWQLLICRDETEADNCVQEILGSQPAGVILGVQVSDQIIRQIKLNKVPVVSFDLVGQQCASIVIDREWGYYQAALLLLKSGYKRVVLLGSSLETHRGMGYSRAYKEAAIPLDTNLVIDAPHGRNLFEYGYREIGNLIQSNIDFSALLAVNDAAAIGAMHKLQETGIHIPMDIAVIGFDNIMVSEYIKPTLTTISQPKHAMARKVMDDLIEYINSKEQDSARDNTKTAILKPEIIFRESFPMPA